MRLPRGMTIGTLPYEWVHEGMPWWDPTKEIKGQLQAISAGLTTPQRVCREMGQGEWEDNMRQKKAAEEFADELGTSVSWETQADVIVPGGSNVSSE